MSGLLALAVIAGPAMAQSSIVVKDSTGMAIEWNDWLGSRTPAAVLIFASWAPGARDAIDRLPELRRACSTRGWTLVIVDVQETFEAAGKTLSGVGQVPWLHDRHGAVLKRYRVIEVPSIVVIDDKGAVLGRIEATVPAVAQWEPDAERE